MTLSSFVTHRPILTYTLVWVLSLLIVSLELIGSGVSGSQALLADVGHVASDTLIALIPLAALLFVRLGWSYRKVTFISSLVAVAMLFWVGINVGGEALQTLLSGEPDEHAVNGILLFVFSGMTAIANILQHRLLSHIDPEHHHGAHQGLHFHILMDLVKNIVLPILGILIALSVLPEHVDLWAAFVIGVLLIARAAVLLFVTLFQERQLHKGHEHT